MTAEPHSSVDSVQDLRTGGRWFDPWLGQYSFFATEFILLSPLSIVSIMVNVGKQPVAWKEYSEECWFKELQENIDRRTGRRERTEILLKTTLNTIQSKNQYFLLITCNF